MQDPTSAADGEPRGKLVLFHGGNLRGERRFWPLSHFGPKAAALWRIRQNYEDRGPLDDRQDWFLYRCEVDPGKNIIDLPDWDSASPAGIIRALYHAGYLTDGSGSDWRLLGDITRTDRVDPLTARQMVLKVVGGLGLTAICYANDHEGDRGELSYCIFDPAQVRVLDQRTINAATLPKIDMTR